jgi:Trk K+ transport system NAD-binding subunit
LWQIRPADAGVIVLGIYRNNGEFIGAPKKDTIVEPEDVLMVYGRDEDVTRALSSETEED